MTPLVVRICKCIDTFEISMVLYIAWIFPPILVPDNVCVCNFINMVYIMYALLMQFIDKRVVWVAFLIKNFSRGLEVSDDIMLHISLYYKYVV